MGMGMTGAGCDCSSGVPGAGREGCVDQDNDTFYSQMDCGSEVDCDDNNNAIFPGATEFCDYKDNNCNGEADEGEGIAKIYCADEDGDSWGNSTKTKRSCFNLEDAPDGEELEGYVDNCNDCDDTDANKWQILSGYADNDDDDYAVGELQEFCVGGNLSPGYVGNPKGVDCDDTDAGKWQFLNGYVDGDGDGYSIGEMQQICSGENLPTGYTASPLGEDCDDTNPDIWKFLFGYVDNDGDNYSVGEQQQICSGETLPPGYVAAPQGEDCNDQSASVWQNVSGYVDNDGDGDGINPLVTVCAGIVFPEGYSNNNWDCDDADSLIYDGITQSVCCGYDGEGERTRICSAGAWTALTPCSIDNFINASNNDIGIIGGSGVDHQPAIDSNWLVFTSTKIGYYGDIFSVNVLGSDGEGYAINQPECLSCNTPSPAGFDCGWGCSWSWHDCRSSSLDLYNGDNNESLDGRVGFECTWHDTAWWDEDFGGFVYTLNPSTAGADGYLSLYAAANVRGWNPIINDDKVALVSNNDIHLRDATDASCWPPVGCNFPWNSAANSPDLSGDNLVFISAQNNAQRVYLENVTNGSISQDPISGPGLNDNGYQPSINDNDIVFTSQSGGVKRLRHYDIGTGTLTSLTTAACGNNYEPDVHGRKVAFTSERDGNKEVYVCDLEETLDCCTGAINISNNAAADYDPSISTCKVAYVTEQTTDKEIFVYDLCEGGCE